MYPMNYWAGKSELHLEQIIRMTIVSFEPKHLVTFGPKNQYYCSYEKNV